MIQKCMSALNLPHRHSKRYKMNGLVLKRKIQTLVQEILNKSDKEMTKMMKSKNNMMIM